MDLVSGWNSLWAAISGGNPKLNTVLAAIGAGIIVFALIKWFIDKRRGGGVSQGLPWAYLGLGGIFAAPTLIIPIALGIIALILNVVVGLIGAFV